ncbi:MAG: hypothetical protein NT157_06820 [Candidatus Micrarchaeota archaeon]|nr:hypothetical protein [Candidatus Micrarchaeota archaeon]
MRRLPLLLLLALFLVFAGCPNPPPQETKGAYYEIVLQDSGAEGVIFSEYMVTEGGLVLNKEITGSISNAPKIRVARASPESAKMELEYVKNNIEGSNYPGCEQCAVYHLFYHDANGTVWHAVSEAEASDFVSEVMSRSEALFGNSERQDILFIQLVYKKSGQNPLVDFHIFGDGTVVYEEFSGWNGPLAAASVREVGPKELESALGAFFQYQDDGIYPEACGRKGFEYSSLEAGRGGEYVFANTCGAGNTDADRAFNNLLELVEK